LIFNRIPEYTMAIGFACTCTLTALVNLKLVNQYFVKNNAVGL